jgi:FixJ family two-component response regulator
VFGEMLIQISEARPIAQSDAQTAAEWTAAADVAHQDQIALPGPVCVVDDDPWVRDSLSVLLETYGYEVSAYSSGHDLLKEHRGGTAGCLVIDQHMPGLAGLDAIAQLQRTGATPPAILITGRLDGAITQRARELGVVAILEKPFPGARLVELVRGLVGPRG